MNRVSRAKVAEFPHYFLGSIIISQRGSESFVVDGQQRLPSLTLLLILLRILQRGRQDAVSIDDLICSERYGAKTFNLAVEERSACMEALFEDEPFDPSEQGESVPRAASERRKASQKAPSSLVPTSIPSISRLPSVLTAVA